jgi:hypothetical protein
LAEKISYISSMSEFIRIPVEEIQYYIKLKPGEYKRATHYALIPSSDMPEGWEDVIYLAQPLTDSSGGVRPREYIYILVNRSIPNMVKIGMTTRTVEERAREISKATGVPTPWIPVYSFPCYASGILERRIHEHLRQYRVNEDKEMFGVTSNIAQQIIEDLGRDFTNILLAESIERNSHLEPPVDTVPTSNRS